MPGCSTVLSKCTTVVKDKNTGDKRAHSSRYYSKGGNGMDGLT